MITSNLLVNQENQDNLKEKETLNIQTKLPPYFIVIEKPNNKKIKIPCASEIVAKRLLASYSNHKSNCKISLM